MLIVCPTCATSYMIDPASVGPSGRAVRCARCKSTWFATPDKVAGPGVTAFVEGVIAEAEAETNKAAPGPRLPRIDASPFSPEPATGFTGSSPAAAAEPDFDHSSQGSQPDDADTVHVADAPPLAPQHNEIHVPRNNEIVAPPPNETDDRESFTARRARLRAKRKQDQRKSRWKILVLALFAVNIALVIGRGEVVRYLPQTASLFAAIGLPVNLRHLEFDGIAIGRETQDGVSILSVEGRIVNTSRSAVDVPRLRFAARSQTGQEVYTWTMQPPRTVLGPGETMAFTSRLAAPPPNAVDVLVRFFTAKDAASGVK